jgi:AcrR family transcriptional regulator
MSAAVPSLGKIRPGKQQRSEQTLEGILDSAEALIAQQGYAATSVSEISRMAGVTIGAFYGRFDGKESILQGLLDRLCEQTLGVFERLWVDLAAGTLGFRRALERSMEAMGWLYTERAALVSAVNQAAATNPALRKRILIFNKNICARLYKALEMYSDEITHPQPALAMKLGHEAGMRLLRSSLLNKEIDYCDLSAAGIQVTDKLLIREAARIWEAYLKSHP